MKVRIVRQPLGHVNGVSLRRYHPHQVYDVAPTLANYLVAQGVAVFEMRTNREEREPGQIERRRKRSH